MVHASWWYYFSKFTEFFDTVRVQNTVQCDTVCLILHKVALDLIPSSCQIFFVLRKKYEHVSALHVVHHGIMPMSVWFGVKFTPGEISWYNLVKGPVKGSDFWSHPAGKKSRKNHSEFHFSIRPVLQARREIVFFWKFDILYICRVFYSLFFFFLYCAICGLLARSLPSNRRDSL